MVRKIKEATNTDATFGMAQPRTNTGYIMHAAIMLTAINKQFCYTKYFQPLLPSRLKHERTHLYSLYIQKQGKITIHEKYILSFATSIQITASNTKLFISRTMDLWLSFSHLS
jgi:hypothetical protein